MNEVSSWRVGRAFEGHRRYENLGERPLVAVNMYDPAMSYYESKRAADEIGVPNRRIATHKISKKSSLTPSIFGASITSSSDISEDITFEERINDFVKKQKRKRNIAKSLRKKVEKSQLLYTVIDLQVGTMLFSRVPGTKDPAGRNIKNVEAFWGFATENENRKFAKTDLVLVGSIDNLIKNDVPNREEAKYCRYNYPSDPGFMASLLNEELRLGINWNDYSAETCGAGYDRCPPEGAKAERAAFITESARKGHGSNGWGWVTEVLPQQRILAIVVDVKYHEDESRTVLARPVLITSTV